MLIRNITSLPSQNLYSNKKTNTPPENNRIPLKRNYDAVKYSQISFAALYNVKPKNFNIDAEKSKLLRQIKDILDVETPDTDMEDIITSALKQALGAVRAKLKKQAEIMKEVDEIYNNKSMPDIQKFERLNALKKQANRLEKNNFSQKPNTPKKQEDERIDYQLVNLFKTSVTEDNFNLRKVFQDYYSGLNEVSTIEELNKKYPKIKTPPDPEDVFSKKVENTLTRDYYEELDEVMDEKDVHKIYDFMNSKLKEYTSAVAEKFGASADDLHLRIADTTLKNMLEKFVKVKTQDGFSSVPIIRKNKIPQITETDINMLCVDYDDFVLSVIKKLYLEGQKPNEIIYNGRGLTIQGNTLKNSDYKFEKVPEKIKKLISTADAIHAAQRDYDHFDVNRFKNRLNFYANSNLGNNEEILEKIIEFDICRFTKEDNASLAKFLRELDDVYDGKKSVEEALDVIRKNDLKPKQTEILNELEKRSAEIKFREEQKRTLQLNKFKESFDAAINLLYENNMNNIANTCSKYRPESFDSKDTENAKFIMEMITKNIKSGKGNELNKPKLEANILRWDTFNTYKNSDSSNPIYLEALRFAKTSEGKADIDKAGQYIINKEIVNNYPESLSYVKNPDVLIKIMERNVDTETAVRTLCKFDDYQNSDTQDKNFITKILKIFDRKDSSDKILLKQIIENEYAQNDTTVLTNFLQKGVKDIPVTFSSKAKKEIIDKYKFPICIEYLADFEEALTSFATQSGTSGIKITSRNNKSQEFKMELKIMGSDARLFSSKNDYNFDIFSERGLH